MRDRTDMWAQIHLDEYGIQIKFKDSNDTLSEFGDQNDTPLQV